MAANQPLVSIGIPVYNGETFLRAALDSLLAQDYENFELIISDNASTDGTAAICQEYAAKDRRIQFHQNDKNLGATYNFTRVRDLASGKYFMWAADHDLWHPTLLSKTLAVLESDPEVVLCYPRAERIDIHGHSLGLANNCMDTRGMTPGEGYVHLINKIIGGDMIYGLISLEALRRLAPKTVWGPDQAILAGLALQGTFAHLPETLFFWRKIRDESPEYRRKTVPQTLDPNNAQTKLDMDLPELWRQLGEECLALVRASSLPDAEKETLKMRTKSCFTRRYGVKWPTSSTTVEVQQSPKKTGARVLLTTSAAPAQSPFFTSEKRPPIGLGFLISVLRDAGHQTFFIDNYLSPGNFLETDYLVRHQIDFVGIYANTICYRDTLRMLHRLEYLRQTRQWQGKIIVGGPHTSVALDTIPPFVDFVVQGEGEQAILDIIEGRVSERVVKRPRIADLDDLPMPAWDCFVNQPYNWGCDWFPETPVFTMNTSRGCPFQCSFCSVGSIWGRKYTCFSAERVVADIEHLIRHYGAKGIYFREDNFTVNQERTVKFCNLLLEKGIKISWACETRVDTLDRDLVALMAQAGLKACYFGVESGSQRLLDFLKKGITVRQTKEAFNLCREFGIKTYASLVVGVPTETEADLNLTVGLINEIEPSVTGFNVFVGIPESHLYRYTLDHQLHEFIDDRGLVYLKGHNDRGQTFYGGIREAQVPVTRNDRGELADPKISVLMAVHNGGPHLEEALKSIFRQTYQNYEFLIIDDASTDETPQILNNLDDFRVRIITNPKNLGLTKSLNLGLREARGKYIARMDADDLSLPHRLERQLEFLEKNPVHVLVGSSYYHIDESGGIKSLIRMLTDDCDLRTGLLQQNWFGHGSVMMRKDAVIQAGGYDERFTYSQDYDLWLRLADSHRLANLAEPLYCWRETSSCITRQKAREQQYFARLAQKRARERQKRAGGNTCKVKPRMTLTRGTPSQAPATGGSRPNQGLNILLALHSFPPHGIGGTELYTYSLAQELRSRGHEVRVLYPEVDSKRPKGDIVEDTYEGLPVTRINLHSYKNLVDNFKDEVLAPAFGRYLDTLQVDLVHFQHFLNLSATLLRVCHDRRIPAVVTAHDEWLICQQCHLLRQNGQLCQGPETVDGCVHCFLERLPQFPRERTPDLFYNLALRRQYLLQAREWMHCLLVPSRFLEQKLAAAGFQHPRTIMFPLGLDPFTPMPHQEQPEVMRFIFLGNMIPVKGLEILIQAFNLAATDRARLDLHGRIADDVYFQNAMALAKNNKNINYHGPYSREDLPQILAQTDVAVVPSRSENYPLVVRECLHAGVPVIASRVGGIPEIIQDGENGLLFTPNDARDLAAKMNFFLEEPQRLLSFRQRIQPVRAIAEDAAQLEEIYHHALNSGALQVTTSSESLLEMATAAIERQDWPAAEGYLQDLNQRYPDLLEPYLSLSDILTLQEKHREAGEVLRAARQIDPGAFPLLKRLGLNCRRRGDLSGAMAALTRVWSQNPRDPEVLGHLGATCMDLGLLQEARGYFQDAVQNNPKDIESWLGLARVARQLENDAAFNQACRRAAALDPAHPRLLELTQGRIPGNGGGSPSTPGEVHDGPQSSQEQVLSSIIIPVFNNLALTRQCLESIWENTDVPFEIIVVDNGSNDGTRDYLLPLEAAGGLRVIANDTNLGFARASNQGAQAAQGEYLVFLNNDTIVQPGWLEELAACAWKDEKIGAVGARLLYADDTIQHAGVAFNEDKLVYHIYKHYDRDHPAVNKEREFQAVTAACALIKKDLFFAVGAFDEGYHNGFEDVDLCLKIRDRGYKVVYNPRALVYHLESKTPGRHAREMENSRRFKSRWHDKIIGDDQKYYEEDGITIEVLDRQGNVATILAHDSNDNVFWREAVKYRRQGDLDRAEACYLRAMGFNPFDPRKVVIAKELADLYETQGKHSQLEKLQKTVPALAPRAGLGGGPGEGRESAGAV